MAERLSRERIAELRQMIEHGVSDPDAQDMCIADTLAVLDAYEQQRPRPASELSEERGWVVGWHPAGRPLAVRRRQGFWMDEHHLIRDIVSGFPLPPAPEVDDGRA